MACVLKKVAASEFEGTTGQKFCLSANSAEGVAVLVSATYNNETKTAEPFCFNIAKGRKALVAVIEVSKPGVTTRLQEKCGDDGTAQELKRRLSNPDDPIFVVVLTGK